jgi:beta-glucosidase
MAMEPYVQAGDLDRICRPLDWFGLNHYSPIYAKANPESALGFGFGPAPAGIARTPIEWPIHPEAFRDTLIQVSERYRLPIYVTENGFGDRGEAPEAKDTIKDERRIAFLAAYTEAMRQAIAQGADVRGYFVWSLLDNFEWGSGYGIRFGLVHVNYKTQLRTPKASFRWYAQHIRSARGRTKPSATAKA